MTLHNIPAWAFLSALIASGITVAEAPPITDLSFTPNAEHVVAVSQSGITVFTWPELNPTRTIPASTPNLHCLAFAPDRKRLAIGGGAPSENGVVEVFSWPEGRSIARYESHNDSVRSVIWQTDNVVLSGSIDREIKLWHLGKAANPAATFQGHSRSIDSLCLIENNQTLVSTGSDQSLRVWDVATGSLIRTLNQHTKPVHALARRPIKDGLPMIASGARDRTIRFWQPTIGRMMRYIRLDSEPLDLVWTHDGERVIAACADGHVRMIDPIEVTVTQDLPALNEWAYAIALHPQDPHAAVAGSNGQIQKIELHAEKQPKAKTLPVPR